MAVYGIDDRLKWGAAALVLMLVAFLYTGGLDDGAQPVQTLRVERDIYIVDPTSTSNTWHEIQDAMFKRLKSPFGQYVVDGEVLGAEYEGSMVDMSVVAIGPNSENLRKVDVLTLDAVRDVWETALRDQNSARAEQIYAEVLAPHSVVWHGLSSEYLDFDPESSEIQIPTADSCKVTALKLLGQTALMGWANNLDSLASKFCVVIRTGLQGIVNSKLLMDATDKECRSQGNKLCSDILGAITVATEAIDDAAKSDASLQRRSDLGSGIRWEYSACMLFGSDMIIMSHETNMEAFLSHWTIPDAENAARKESHRRIGNFERLSGKILIGMPKRGVKERNNLSDNQKDNLKAYWEAFFDETGAEVTRGSAATACNS